VNSVVSISDSVIRADTARLEALDHLAEASRQYLPTARHAHRVAALATRIAWRLGWREAERDLLERATPYHDLGKLGVPARLLARPGPLEAHEFAIVKEHTVLGAAVLMRGDSAVMQAASVIALEHHERWNGSGYPRGASGAAISPMARVVAVADVFDALTRDRPYKGAWSVPQALAYVAAQAGEQFDPSVVDAFLSVARGLGI
jgi:putative two-component system response regulator